MADEQTSEGMLKELPRDRILAMLQDEEASGQILEDMVRIWLHDQEVCWAILHHPGALAATLYYIAENAAQSLAESIAQDKALLGKFPEVRKALLANPHLGPEVTGQLQREAEKQAEGHPEGKEDKGKKKQDLYRMIKGLSSGQRLALAKKGNKEVRMILIRDPNEMVALEVVSSPRITDSEIIYISQLKDVSEKVLRSIANSRRYRSNKLVVLNLLHNPKTPVSVSLNLGISGLSDRELSGLAKDRNIPGAVSRAATMVLEKRKKQVSAPGRGH